MNCMRVFKAISLGLILCMSLISCGAGSEKWREEVQLSDGRVIVVERELVLEAGGDEWAANRRGVKPKENKLSFLDPDGSGKMIEWYSTKKTSDTWPEIPLILDSLSGQWVVFSSVSRRGGCLMYNKYFYQNGIWVEEILPPTFEQRATNLYVFQNEGLDFIDLNHKRESISAIGYKRYAQVGPTHPNCKGL